MMNLDTNEGNDNNSRLVKDVVRDMRSMIAKNWNVGEDGSEMHPLSEIGMEYEEKKQEFLSNLDDLQEMLEKQKRLLETSSQDEVRQYTALLEGHAVDYAYLEKYETVFDRLSILAQQNIIQKTKELSFSENNYAEGSVEYFKQALKNTLSSKRSFTIIMSELKRICTELTDEVRVLNFEVEDSTQGTNSKASIQIGSNGNSQEHCFAILLELDDSIGDCIQSLAVIFAYDTEWTDPAIDEDVRKCISEGRFRDLKQKLKWILSVEGNSDTFPESSDSKLKETVLQEFKLLNFYSIHHFEGPCARIFDPVPSMFLHGSSFPPCEVSFLGLFGNSSQPQYTFQISPPIKMRVQDVPEELGKLTSTRAEKPDSLGSFTKVLNASDSCMFEIDGMHYCFQELETEEMKFRAIAVSHFKISKLSELARFLPELSLRAQWSHLYYSCFQSGQTNLVMNDESIMCQIESLPPTAFRVSVSAKETQLSMLVTVHVEGPTVLIESSDQSLDLSDEYATQVLRLVMSIPALVSNCLF